MGEVDLYPVTTSVDGPDMFLVRDVSDNGVIAAGKMKQVSAADLGTSIGGAGGSSAGTTPQYPVVMAPVKWALVNYDAGRAGLGTNYTYANGTAGVGATITATVNGVLAADSGSPAVNDRVLILDPYAWGTGDPPHADGIYTVTSVGSVSTPYVLTRATDCNTAATLGRYWAVAITAGTVFGGGWAAVQAISDVTGVQTFVVGTTFLGFSLAAASAFSAGGWNSAAGNSSVVLGSQGTATGPNSVVLGNTASAAALFATAIGAYSNAIGQASVTVGYQSNALGADSVSLGAFSNAYENGMISKASNYNNNKGDAQSCEWYPCQTTTNATPIALVGPFNQVLHFRDLGGGADYGKTMLFKATIVARRTDTPGTDSAWTMQGVLRGNGSSAYSWIGGSAPTATLVAQDSGASTWGIAVSVSGNALTLTATGQAGKTIDWTAKVETVEAA